MLASSSFQIGNQASPQDVSMTQRDSIQNLCPFLAGGGHNHRMGLYDMMMIKDNHVTAAGGIPAAIARAEAYIVEKVGGICAPACGLWYFGCQFLPVIVRLNNLLSLL
jgi:hypothetical protein